MSQHRHLSLRWALLLLIAVASSTAAAEEASLSANLASLRAVAPLAAGHRQAVAAARAASQAPAEVLPAILAAMEDRKSTRLNSSHSQISYAVFCLKKKRSKQDR